MKIITATILLMLSSASYAYTNLNVDNHTDATGTAKTKSSPCSSSAGSSGVLKPHGSLNVPELALTLYCYNQCDVDLYLSNNCTGPSVATAHVKHSDGVVSINNHNESGYRLTGSGSKLVLENAAGKKGFFDFLKSLV